MDLYDMIDYKRPISPQLDMRTSTYIGTRYLNEAAPRMRANIGVRMPTKYIPEAALPYLNRSTYQLSYDRKFPNPHEKENPILGSNIQFVKGLDETKFRFLKPTTKPARSITATAYQYRQPYQAQPLIVPALQSATKASSLVIDRSKCNFSKYLDPAITVTREDYVGHSPERVASSVAAKDNITLWNWEQKDCAHSRVHARLEHMCDNKSQERCRKRDEFPESFIPVPNSGMTTEARSAYPRPDSFSLDNMFNRGNQILSYIPWESPESRTSQQVYGSGHTYVRFL